MAATLSAAFLCPEKIVGIDERQTGDGDIKTWRREITK